MRLTVGQKQFSRHSEHELYLSPKQIISVLPCNLQVGQHVHVHKGELRYTAFDTGTVTTP